MEYEISWLERSTTSTGKQKITATIIDPHGVKTEGVTLWKASWPNFDQLMPSMKVQGDLSVTQNGQYTNKTLFQGKTWSAASKSNGGAYRGSQATAKAQETKREDIKEAQETKHEAIKLAGAQRDAVLIVTNFYKDLDASEVRIKIQEWMKYFIGLQDQPFI